jgi:hypothetical protein
MMMVIIRTVKSGEQNSHGKLPVSLKNVFYVILNQGIFVMGKSENCRPTTKCPNIVISTRMLKVQNANLGLGTIF